MDKDIRLVSMDLDGTLFQRNGLPSAYTKDVLRRLREHGILVMINSGRPIFSVRQRVGEGLYDYVSTRNGQEIFDEKNHTSWANAVLSEKDVRELFDLCLQYPVMFNCFYEDHTVLGCARKYQPAALLVRKAMNHRWKIRREEQSLLYHRFEDTGIQGAAKICVAGLHHTLKKMDQKLDQARFHGVFVGLQWYEVMAAGVSKGKALRQVMEKEGLTRQQCIAIGDGENDLDMLAASGYGLAMANGMDALKKASDEVIGSNEEDGAAHWLEEHLLK